MTEEQNAPPSRSVLLRGVILSVLILMVGVVAARVLSRMRERPTKKSLVKALTLRVETRKVSFGESTLRLRGYGTAVPGRRVTIVPEVSGRVVYTIKPFKVGTYVRRGQLLLRVDPSNYLIEFQRLKAQVSSLKKQIEIAARAYKVSQRNLSRSRRLVRRGALDQGSFERVEQMVLDRGQRLESLRQALAVNKLMLRRAALNLSRTSIRAPFDAQISRGELTKGDFVAMGRGVATLESVDKVEIPVAFPLEKLRKIRDEQGQPVPLQQIPTHLQKLPPVLVTATGLSWKGRVVRVGANIDLSTRTLTLFVQVNLKKLKRIGSLLPGTFCQVEIPVQVLKRAFGMPRRAVYGKHVFVVEGGKLARREVKIAYQDSESVLIVGGLRPDELAIITQLTDPIVGTPVFTNHHK